MQIFTRERTVTTIVNAISALTQSLDKLETAASEQVIKSEQAQKKAALAGQQDLFNGNGHKSNGVANGNGAIAIDPALLAKKLDVTIERVEQLLKEG